MHTSYSDPAVAAFVVIPALLAALLVWSAARATTTRMSFLVLVAVIIWMSGTWIAADTGVFRKWTQNPPPFGLLVLSIVVLSVIIAFSQLGRAFVLSLPLWALVAVQSFRLPLELAMHAMFERGIMPVQMSYSGRNFDIVTGATALIVAALVATRRGGTKLVALWNVMGLALVLNVVIVAILSTPRFRYFGDQRLNVWVTYPPFVWLPAVMVLAAFAGHLLIFRALWLQRRRAVT